MAARTRGQIKTVVNGYTQRATEKDALINTLSNEALKLAGNIHPFRDSRSEPAVFAITEDAVSVAISSVSGLVHVVTARILEDDSERYAPLIIKDIIWWHKHVINPEDNQKGWPKYGLRWKGYVYFDRPANANLSLKLVVTTEQTFTDDTTVCPIGILDVFVTAYVTAFVFLAIEQRDTYVYWHQIALGPAFNKGKVGGLLLQAINSDQSDLAEEPAADIRLRGQGPAGVSVLNQLVGHDDFGNTRVWYPPLEL